jgi:hypothetical protein
MSEENVTDSWDEITDTEVSGYLKCSKLSQIKSK